jgi:hypothetical protein
MGKGNMKKLIADSSKLEARLGVRGRGSAPVKYAPVKQGTRIGFTPVEHPAGTRFNGASGVNFAVTIVPQLIGP